MDIVAVIGLIVLERSKQVARGYDAAHDHAHGPAHLVELAGQYVDPWNRDALVKAAALLVAAIEVLDK